MQPEEGIARLRVLGFGEEAAGTLWKHFADAEHPQAGDALLRLHGAS